MHNDFNLSSFEQILIDALCKKVGFYNKCAVRVRFEWQKWKKAISLHVKYRITGMGFCFSDSDLVKLDQA